jgi:hypothetical protein
LRRGITTIVGLGTVTALFLAIMSVFYLQQIPTKADLERLADDVRTEHGLYLSAATRVDVKLVRPPSDGQKSGLEVRCMFRADIRQRPEAVRLYLARIAEGILAHPEWRGKIAYVTVAHAGEPEASVTRRPGQPVVVEVPPPLAPPTPPR